MGGFVGEGISEDYSRGGVWDNMACRGRCNVKLKRVGERSLFASLPCLAWNCAGLVKGRVFSLFPCGGLVGSAIFRAVRFEFVRRSCKRRVTSSRSEEH